MKRPGLVLLLLLTTFAYYRWYHLPEASALQAKAVETTAMKDELNRLRASIASTKHEGSPGQPMDLPEPRHPSFMISRLATSAAPALPASARLTTISTSGTRDVGGLTCEDMNLAGSGRLDEIIAFFRNVESIRPQIGIRSWSLSVSSPTGDRRAGDRSVWNAYQMQISYIKSGSTLAGDTWSATTIPSTVTALNAAPVADARPSRTKRVTPPAVTLEALPGSGARIEGILMNSQGPSAMIGGRLVRQGAMVDGLKFMGVENHLAKFRGEGGRMILIAWAR
ncbi:MAG: hypothetical protein AAB229_07795 [Candidatus Hydrogenedentota bacterium]